MDVVYIQNTKYKDRQVKEVFIVLVIFLYTLYLTKVLGKDFISAVLNLYNQMIL